MSKNDWSFQEDDETFNLALSQRTEELYRIPDFQPDSDGIAEAIVLPLRDLVIYPHMVSPVFVARESSLLAIQEAHQKTTTLVGLTQVDPDQEDPGKDEFLPIGVEMAVGRLLSMPDGSSSALVQGRRRVEVLEFTQLSPFMKVKVRVINEPLVANRKTKALMRTALELFENCVQMDRSIPEEAHMFALNISEPGWLADMIATAVSIKNEDRQELLLTTDAAVRLARINHLLAQEVDVLELEEDIHNKVQSEVDRSQREFYLREQMKAIQMELGEGDLYSREISDIRAKIEEVHLPVEAQATAMKEMERLLQMPPMAPEVGIIRTYIDWIVDLPWTRFTEDNLSVKNAAKVLDRDHYGLKKAKDRILEYIAVRSLHPKKERQPILCFVGPPGTGKTSLGRSIAEALGRKFVRISLGGVRDEAEIRGHRRTYIGAMPGRIIQTIKRAGTANPLFMLDEIDKLGADFRGDPSSALLEVLDPEQNNSFSDHYLELAYDLSKVMFITTANYLGTIPPALLDRMEVIDFSGYIEEEKLFIAEKFLIPRQTEENGIESINLSFSRGSLKKMIREYTYEAGVRNLEREIGKICRKVARTKAEKKKFPLEITEKLVEKYLGPPQFFQSEAELQDEVGVATGLAWTENGGETLSIEVAIFEGKGSMQITGQVGDVMQESAQAGLSYLKSRAALLKIDMDVFERHDIHMHLPEGAIPKDGPSAGITLCTALVSAFTGRSIDRSVAMTGEVTLRGRVLPVGGVRDKILAAYRAGIKKVILPERNLKDLIDIPKEARDALKIIPVNHMDQVLKVALSSQAVTNPPTPRPRSPEVESSDEDSE